MRFLTFLLLLATLASADIIVIDRNQSSIRFEAQTMWLDSVRGAFTSFDAAIVYDTKSHLITSCLATVPVASIATSDASRDENLKSRDYFNADYYPQMSFEMNEIFNNHIVGYMTIMDITRPLSLHIKTFDISGRNVTLELDGELNRDEFGITKSSHFLIGKMIQLTIVIKGRLSDKAPSSQTAPLSSGARAREQ